MPGTLYLVATPIGNLQDITHRAIETLRSVDLIACEDTRHTGKLLKAYDIKAKKLSYHQHNENERAVELREMLLAGQSIALVSDAGTPSVSDPGFAIIREAIAVGASVIPIPGAAAFVAAVTASGLDTRSIYFGGFLPPRRAERQKRFAQVKDIPATLVFYETPLRLVRALEDAASVLGNRKAAVARELTKMHEEIQRGTLTELKKLFEEHANLRGELVLVIDDESAESVFTEDEQLIRRVKELEDAGIERRAALKVAAKELGMTRSEAYRIMVRRG